MEHDRIRWDERYADRVPPVPAAPEIVRGDPDLLAEIPAHGRALDVACGVGAEALWLAQRGLDVMAIDVSPVAIGMLRDAAEALGLADRIDARVHDTDDGLPADANGLAVVLCQRYRAVDLYPDLVARLAPGGVLLLTVLSVVGAGDAAGTFHASAGELDRAFGHHDVLSATEGGGAASIAVRRAVS